METYSKAMRVVDNGLIHDKQSRYEQHFDDGTVIFANTISDRAAFKESRSQFDDLLRIAKEGTSLIAGGMSIGYLYSDPNLSEEDQSGIKEGWFLKTQGFDVGIMCDRQMAIDELGRWLKDE